jgi:hypothetical protein
MERKKTEKLEKKKAAFDELGDRIDYENLARLEREVNFSPKHAFI